MSRRVGEDPVEMQDAVGRRRHRAEVSRDREPAEDVRKELQRRNPGFDGKVEHKIEDGVVSELKIVTDKVIDISPLRVFNALRVLDLNGTHTAYVGNGQLADLSPLTGMNLAGLSRLNLSFTMAGDAGLVHFNDCTNLTFLKLVGTKVTDAGLAHLKNHQGLTHLLLANTEVSDTGLAHFKDHKKLELVDVRKTKVSAAGIDELKKASPQCKFEWDGKVNDPK